MIIEDQFISCILEEKLSLKDIQDSNFETTWLRENGEIYEFIDDYISQNSQLPSGELVETRFPLFKRVPTKDVPLEILDALRKNTELDRTQNMIRQANKLLLTTGNAEKVRLFLEEKIEKLTPKRKSVYDITDPSFRMDEDDYARRRVAFQTGGSYGIPTGFGKELDSFLNGGYQKGMGGYVSRSGVGKTWTLCTSIVSAMRSRQTPYLLALEGTEREVYRILTVATGISNSDILAGKIDMFDYLEAKKKFQEMAKAMEVRCYIEFIGDHDFFSPRDLRRSIVSFKPDVAFIDYLTLMKKSADTNDYNDYTDISQETALTAQRYSLPIVNALQGVIKMGSDLTMESIATSKGMSRDFDWLLGIDLVDNKKNWIKVTDLKARDGKADFAGLYRTGWDNGKVEFGGWDYGEGGFE